jgi:hypothetical protein
MNPGAEEISEHSAYEATDSNKQDLYHRSPGLRPKIKKPLLQLEVGVINLPGQMVYSANPIASGYLKRLWARSGCLSISDAINQSIHKKVAYPLCPCLFSRRNSSTNVFHDANNSHRLDAHGRHAHQQIDHLLLIVREAVGVELFADGWVFGFLFFVLVENPFQGRAVAESVVPTCSNNGEAEMA